MTNQRQVRVAEGIYRRDTKNGKVLYVATWDPAIGKKGGKRWWSGGKHGFRTIPEARAFKRAKEQERSKVGTSRETVASYAERWLDLHPRRQAVTNQHNAAQVAKFAADHGSKELRAIRPVDAQKWATENPWRAPQVRAMFADAVRDGLLDENPFRGVRLPREVHEGRSNIVVLEEAELALLVRTAEEEHGDYGQVYGAMILVAAYTGMRPGEMYGLRWTDIDWEKDELHIRRQWRSKTAEMDLPKGGKPRTIVLLPEAAAALKRVPRRADSEQVFFTKQGSDMSQRVQHYYFDPVRRAFWNKLPPSRQEVIPRNFDFYTTRHFFGTYLAQVLECTPFEIAQMMGHQDGGQLAQARYIHTEAGRMRESVKARMRAKLAPGGEKEAV